jgi:hypothetical protein
MDDSGKTALVIGGVVVAGTLLYFFWPKTASASTSNSSAGPVTFSPVTVTYDQTRLNAIAAKQNWPLVPLNGLIQDPTFVSTLAQFQAWFNANYTPAQASISGPLNTSGTLDPDTSGALIYVYEHLNG